MPFKEYSKEKMRFYRSLILFGLILFYGLQNIPTLWMIFMRFLSVLTPFFIGGALAFVLNILVVKIECLLKYTSIRPSMMRKISVFGSLLIFVVIFGCLLFVVIPHIRPRSKISSSRSRRRRAILWCGLIRSPTIILSCRRWRKVPASAIWRISNMRICSVLYQTGC